MGSACLIIAAGTLAIFLLPCILIASGHIGVAVLVIIGILVLVGIGSLA